jgi:ATPase family AAA domain-containing protein 2
LLQDEYKFDEPNVPAAQTEIVATTVEVQADPNGVAIVVDEEQTLEQIVNGNADGPSDGQHQQQIVEQLPTLFDMDLERMHAELYMDKYIVPQDFLDDVQKIVHNADIRMQEDPERFYKAQAILTAAQVSINDFDPQLRLECDRMAPRERKRREERKKSRPKGKVPEDADNGATYAPGTRRSARNNGQQPELSITDPLKIERRLKRSRVTETGVECVPSEEDESDSQTTKRSKVNMETSDDNDPLDILGPTSSQPQQMTVRFAGRGIVTC